MGEKGFIPVPDFEVRLRPDKVQNLMCLVPQVTNSLLLFQIAQVTGDLSTLELQTILDYCQS